MEENQFREGDSELNTDTPSPGNPANHQAGGAGAVPRKRLRVQIVNRGLLRPCVHQYLTSLFNFALVGVKFRALAGA